MKRAITVTVYALVPFDDEDDYNLRLGEIADGAEHGCQDAGADYIGPFVKPGIPAEMSDAL